MTSSGSISIAEYRALLSSGTKAKPGKRSQPEEDLHRACIEWVAFNQARIPRLKWLIHVPNGGKRSRGEAGKMKALGVKKGVIDLMLPRPSPLRRWQGLAIELKSPTGKPSDDQKEWLAAHHEDGWLVGIAKTLDQFIELVEAYAADAQSAQVLPFLPHKTKAPQAA